MGGLLLPRITRMRGIGMIERLAVDVLRMFRQMMTNRWRQIGIDRVRHAFPPSTPRPLIGRLNQAAAASGAQRRP